VSTLTAHGLGVTLPAGWDGEIFTREPSPAVPQSAPASANPMAGALASIEEERLPVVHAANFSLPPGRGDFGGGAVELMGARNLFISLFEYGSESVGTPLFAHEGRPTLRADDFDPQQMQRTIAGQSGKQAFFQEAGRAFCLYVALGSHHLRGLLVQPANQVVSSLVIA
jgi:hypothetical protein